jgi:hypothetical protein
METVKYFSRKRICGPGNLGIHLSAPFHPIWDCRLIFANLGRNVRYGNDEDLVAEKLSQSIYTSSQVERCPDLRSAQSAQVLIG